jgi:hypothetical protein
MRPAPLRPGERAVVIDYSDHDHEFASFRDEVREIYPGVYLGKMYALPGTELWGGVLALPPDSPPRFAINFILFGQPGQTTVQALQAPMPATPGAQGTPFMLSSGGSLSGGL